MRKLLSLFGAGKRDGETPRVPDPSEGDHSTGPDNGPAVFAPQNPLEEALVRASSVIEARTEFIRVLMESDLIFATPQPDGLESDEDASELLQILNVPFDDGTTVPAVFTSVVRVIEAFGPDVGHVALQGRDALRILATDGAVLNPASTYGVAWSPEDLTALLGMPVPRTIESPTQVMLATPSQQPQALIDRIRAIVDSEPRIEAAWLALAAWPDADGHSWYLDVRTAAPREAIAPLFTGVGKAGETEGMALDIIFRTADQEPGSGIEIKPLAAR
ncbi:MULTISPECIES: SseB family protein [unclassified Novosphingobium]|uniref:SseB family protein n=1 Tax=unclassified Novosphingobium TaxID=2644732 RepID=UPI001469F9FC|nr:MULTISPECIES: SseB family protein [unclassified Novosphingobium]NMN03901.1 hypothetical protein [Novosphingobium sp. SG919]NMN86109.1 hypothetical protein [Novosphingobium sp. SG916]